MNKELEVKNNNSNAIQIKRREIQIRREKAHALAQYKRVASQAKKQSKPLPSKEPISINHAIFFTICLGVGSVMVPELMGIAIIFSVLILGQTLSAQFDWFQKREEEKAPKANISDAKMIRMVKQDVVKLSHKKKKVELPIHKSEAGVAFIGEDGATVTQFDWRQLSEAN
ncbi:MAG: hypothetical protein ACJAT2_000498 [Bacteriovoracaceae bacterium]|jgi:hypothetical protein